MFLIVSDVHGVALAHRYLMASRGNNFFHVRDCKNASQVREVHRERECGGTARIVIYLEDLYKQVHDQAYVERFHAHVAGSSYRRHAACTRCLVSDGADTHTCGGRCRALERHSLAAVMSLSSVSHGPDSGTLFLHIKILVQVQGKSDVPVTRCEFIHHLGLPACTYIQPKPSFAIREADTPRQRCQ